MSSNSETDKDSGIVIRPLSEMLVDLHVYRIPNDHWLAERRLVKNNAIDYSISAGFIRVLPELTLQDVRKEIAYQLGFDVLPSEFIFLRCIGKNFAKVRNKQERHLKVKFYLPPFVIEPEVFLLKNPENLIASSSQSEIEIKDQIDKLNCSRRKQKRFYQQKRASSAKSIGRESFTVQDSSCSLSGSNSITVSRFPLLNPQEISLPPQPFQLTEVNFISHLHMSPLKVRTDASGLADGRLLKRLVQGGGYGGEERGALIMASDAEEKKSDDVGEADTDITVSSWDSGVNDSPKNTHYKGAPHSHGDWQLLSFDADDADCNKSEKQASKLPRYTNSQKSMSIDEPLKNRPNLKMAMSTDADSLDEKVRIISHESDALRITKRVGDDIKTTNLNTNKNKTSELQLQGGEKQVLIPSEITNTALEMTTWPPKSLSFHIPIDDDVVYKHNSGVHVKNERDTISNRTFNDYQAYKSELENQSDGERNTDNEKDNNERMSKLANKITNNNTHDKQPEMKDGIAENKEPSPQLDTVSSSHQQHPQTITDNAMTINDQSKPISIADNGLNNDSNQQNIVPNYNNSSHFTADINDNDNINADHSNLDITNISKTNELSSDLAMLPETAATTYENVEFNDEDSNLNVANINKANGLNSDLTMFPESACTTYENVKYNDENSNLNAEDINEACGLNPNLAILPETESTTHKNVEFSHEKSNLSAENIEVTKHLNNEQPDWNNKATTGRNELNSNIIVVPGTASCDEQSVLKTSDVKNVTENISDKKSTLNQTTNEQNYDSSMLPKFIENATNAKQPNSDVTTKNKKSNLIMLADRSSNSNTNATNEQNTNLKLPKASSSTSKNITSYKKPNLDMAYSNPTGNSGTTPKGNDSNGLKMGENGTKNKNTVSKPRVAALNKDISIEESKKAIISVSRAPNKDTKSIMSETKPKLNRNNSTSLVRQSRPTKLEERSYSQSKDSKLPRYIRQTQSETRVSNQRQISQFHEPKKPTITVVSSSPNRRHHYKNNKNAENEDENPSSQNARYQNKTVSNANTDRIRSRRPLAATPRRTRKIDVDSTSAKLLSDNKNVYLSKNSDINTLNNKIISDKAAATAATFDLKLDNSVLSREDANSSMNSSRRKKVPLNKSQSLSFLKRDTDLIERNLITDEIHQLDGDFHLDQAKSAEVLNKDDITFSKFSASAVACKNKPMKSMLLNLNPRIIQRRSLVVSIDDLPDWLWLSNYQNGPTDQFSTRRELLAILRVLRARRRKAKRIYQDYICYVGYLRDDQEGYGRIGLAVDMWKRKYGEELRETHILRNSCQRLQQQLKVLLHQNSSKLPPTAPSDPSNLASLKATAMKLISEIETLSNKVEDAKIQVTTESKLKTQVVKEAKMLRAEAVDRKIDAAIIRAQNHYI